MLRLAQLPQVEHDGELVRHGAQRQERTQDLRQQEGEVDGVHRPLQRQDDDVLVRHEEQQDGQLEHEGEKPERCQLWNLEERQFTI